MQKRSTTLKKFTSNSYQQPVLIKNNSKVLIIAQSLSSLCDLTELRAKLKEVKTDIANSAIEQHLVTTDYLSSEMTKQAAQIAETVQSDMTSQSEVVKELQSEVRTIVTALREQTRAQLKEVKADIANSTKELVTIDYLSTEMNKQAAKIETVQSDMTSQSEVVKELQSEVTALRKQTEIAVEQQRQIKESL